MSSILILVHLLPPSPHGRKSPGKLSAKHVSDYIVKFIKTNEVLVSQTGTSVQRHLDGIWTASGKAFNPICLLWGPRGV
ncbi:Hypothetical protein SMAX5B_007691 [Scophthalmus maximus]|uniref:Uncharacterized protein n=1 Tax=Scophthalmus maximus TaxID=52904 RepID=A0A2U9B1L8_SCOMX|nr:Hypothetical protein SMAX5B_007691 [Scophthalmus maximus]